MLAMELRVAFARWRGRARHARMRRYRAGFSVQHHFDVWWCTLCARKHTRAFLAGRVERRRRLVLWLCGAWWRWWAGRKRWLRQTLPYLGPPLRG